MSELSELTEFLLCKIGCHKFVEKRETQGSIDCVDSELILQITWIGCARNGCTVTKDIKKEYIEVKKPNTKTLQEFTEIRSEESTEINKL